MDLVFCLSMFYFMIVIPGLKYKTILFLLSFCCFILNSYDKSAVISQLYLTS